MQPYTTFISHETACDHVSFYPLIGIVWAVNPLVQNCFPFCCTKFVLQFHIMSTVSVTFDFIVLIYDQNMLHLSESSQWCFLVPLSKQCLSIRLFKFKVGKAYYTLFQKHFSCHFILFICMLSEAVDTSLGRTTV